MKIKPARLTMILIISGISLLFIGGSIAIGFIDRVFDTNDLYLIIVLIVMTLAFIIYTWIRNVYDLTKNGVVQPTLFSKKFYAYSDIIYISESVSLKTKTLTFYTKTGTCYYLPLDKKCILLKEMQKRCKNLLTPDEFIKKFPNIKI